MKLIAATENKNKLSEFRRILSPLGIEVLSVSDVGVESDVEETGISFMENAEIKARAIYALTGLPAFADDSGLCIDALGGDPGIFSARYGGEDLPHSEKIKLILEKMSNVPRAQRTARFIAAIYCVLDENHSISCEDTCEGEIGFSPLGSGGFGYDPIFMVGERSFSEFTDAEKDAVSHRGKALREFVKKLNNYL